MPSHAASAHLLHGSMPGRAALDRTAFVSLKSWMARSLEEWEPLDMGEERRRAPWDAWRQRRAFLGGSTRPFQVTMRLSMWARRNAAAAASAAPRVAAAAAVGQTVTLFLTLLSMIAMIAVAQCKLVTMIGA